MPIRCLIVDDEPPARQLILELLVAHSDLEVVGICEDGVEAVTQIERLKPDLVFLDIQMPEMTGFEVLEVLVHRPQIIFSTAYDHYAVQAFEVSAVDYLLKPYVQSRFDEAMARVRARISAAETPAQLDRLLEAVRPVRKPLVRLLVREGDRMVLVPVREIFRAEALEDYVQIHSNRGRFLISQTLGWLEGRLDPDRFVRIHRSHLIQLSAIAELRHIDNGRMTCVLANETELPVSRAGVKRLKEAGS